MMPNREAHPEPLKRRFLWQAEHSMIDAYYVILGSLTGARATLDEEIREDLLLLCPDCFFVSPKGITHAGANTATQGSLGTASSCFARMDSFGSSHLQYEESQ